MKGLLTLGMAGILTFAAFSSSPSYKLQNYGVGAGGTNTSGSSSYKLNASSGEVTGAPSAGATTGDKSGSLAAQQANVPPAPTLSNGSGAFYNKLLVTINKNANDASDYTYAIATSTNSFVTTLYVQADGTLGASPIYQSYATWGGSSGSNMIGLIASTTYQVKVSAQQGKFTASAFGPAASQATGNAALSFSVSPSSIALGSLTPGTVVTGGTAITVGFDTNAAAGGAVYIAGLNAGLKSAAANYTVPSLNADLSSSSEGFGVRGVSATQASGGPLTITSPFNGAGNNVGAPNTLFQTLFSSATATTGGSGTANVMGKASSTTASAADYSETLTLVASASF